MPTFTAAESAYQDLAPWYDRLTADHDYEAWLTTLLELAESRGLAGTRALDVACGTGKSFLPLLDRGYDVVACDLSEAMAAHAAAKAGRAADVRVADMRELPAWGPFDLVLCLGDSVNYLLDAADLDRAFSSAARNLRPGGIYVFDVNTLTMYREAFLVDRCVDDGELYFAWHGRPPEPLRGGGLARAEIEIFAAIDGDRWSRRTSRHVQRHHPEALLRAALGAAGFADVSTFGQDMTGAVLGAPDEERHTKTVFVARRCDSVDSEEVIPC